MDDLGIKKDSDLYIQNEQKTYFLNEILNIFQNNKSFLINFLININQNKNMVDFEINPIVISLNEKFGNKYMENIIDYFKDYGMCLYFFEFIRKSDSSKCNIF